MSAQEVTITLIKSPIGRVPKHRGTLRALGLFKIGEKRTHKMTPQLAGMIRNVSYMISVEPSDKK
ncbi:MAG: 50S ribosomal protein L30 [Spirochaetia bacterium]|nr:50S ribosomal protein L30 [Spirochaetia bacterium]